MNDVNIPVIDETFSIPEYGESLGSILLKGGFFPVNIVGPTGSGKTFVVEQLCARLKLPMIRVNLTLDTDESALIGGFRLTEQNGTTVTKFEHGPVLKAMQNGCILLLDEIDLAPPGVLMCLMSILEGGSYFVKHTGEVIFPQPGFNIVSTSNTRGRGDDTGKYVSTNVQNEAFLERFIVVFDAPYMSNEIETEILNANCKKMNISNDGFVKKLVNWADNIRKSVKENVDIEYDISTRRLIHIIKTYSIFNDERASVSMCVNRFDNAHKTSFMEMYDILDNDGASETIQSNYVIPDDIRKAIQKLGTT